jgi:hypothetical protein
MMMTSPMQVATNLRSNQDTGLVSSSSKYMSSPAQVEAGRRADGVACTLSLQHRVIDRAIHLTA